MLVCPSCFGQSTALQSRFDQRGTRGTCPTCGTDGVRALPATELSDLFDGLKAHYEPLIGDTYRLGKEGVHGLGPDTGHDSLEEILREDWEVFSDKIDDAQAEDILRAVWPGYVGEYLRDERKLWQQVRDDWDRLKRSSTHEWRFFLNDNTVGQGIGELLDPWVDALESSLECRSWRRARIQQSRDDVFGEEAMGAPPPEKACAGRANPPGIPHVYVASDEATAVAEVRGEPGDWVTVAIVEIRTNSRRILDLTKDVRVIDPFDHDDIYQALVLRELLQIFSDELSRPVRPADHEIDYVCTQFVSEYFRANGFIGIVYRSSLAKGTNAVFFDPSIAIVTSCARRAVWSKSVDVIEETEFDRRDRKRRGFPF